jgi:DNA-binding Lrp family transcriptional regulator
MKALDAKIVRATQAGLPLVREPYVEIAARLGISPVAVTLRLKAMLADGRVRRIGAVPNHYALGYTANAMSVWDVADERVKPLGAVLGKLEFVSHCYLRPRRLPDWPYNLFAMVHGRSRAEAADKIEIIRGALGPALRASDVLYSTRILKKTGMRLA